jgi:hypothetical protein
MSSITAARCRRINRSIELIVQLGAKNAVGERGVRGDLSGPAAGVPINAMAPIAVASLFMAVPEAAKITMQPAAALLRLKHSSRISIDRI